LVVSNSRPGRQVAVIAACVCLTACAGQVRPDLSATPPRSDALLILPGFGYGREAEHALRELNAQIRSDGFDLYVPAYISRGGLGKSRERLQRFLGERRLDRYERVHVFAFIAGGWALNPLVEAHALPNLATVVYDRSPLQERAARIATDDLHLLTWLRYGSPVFDLARTPYPPLNAPRVRVGLVVETKPTAFVQRREASARRYGPIEFDCKGFAQDHDDCVYLPMNHGQVYTRFGDVWPEVRAFIRNGRFTSGIDRTPPRGDPFGATRSE
jgi:hypothetical protein